MENEIKNTTNEPEVQETVVESETQETATEPQTQETVVESETQETATEPQVQSTKKSFKALKITLCIAIPLILIVSAVILNYNNIVGFFIKQFGSPNDYLKYVEAKSYTQYINDTTEFYETYLTGITENKSATSQVKLNIGENAQSTINSLNYSGANINLDALKNISFNANYTNTKDVQAGSLDILLSNENILSLVGQFVPAENKFYIALKELTDKVIGIDLSEQVDFNMPISNQGVKNAEYLPDSKALNKLITKYADLIVSKIDNISESEQAIKVGNIEQKCTVLEYKLNNALITSIASAVLNEVKNDAEFKSVYEGFEKAFGADEAGSTYSTFIQSVDSLISSMNSAEAPADDTVIANIKCYVNSSYEVIGRCIEIPSAGTTIELVTVHKGADFETKCVFTNTASQTGTQEVSLIGKGTDKNNKVNGTYTVNVFGSEILSIELVDFASNDIAKGIASGTIRITPNMASLSQIGGGDENVTTLLALINPSLEMKLQSTKDNSTVDFNLLSNGNLFFGFNMNTVVTEAKQVESIASENAIDITDSAQAQKFLTSIDIDKLIEKLNKLSIPESITNQLKQYSTLLNNASIEVSY